MARTTTAIKNSITSTFMENTSIQTLYALDPSKTFAEQFSTVSFENILFDILTYIMWTLEVLFDTHRTEVSEILTQLKPHTAKWYRQKALDFQFGFDLITDTDVFQNTGFSEEQIEASKIIKYAAVTEATTESRLIIKIATEDGDGNLSPITSEQNAAFVPYFEEIKDAGVKITVINYLADVLSLQLQIYYDPLVLNAQGISIISGKEPVKIALKEFMKELPFNGELVLASLVDKLQQTEGVKIPHLVSAATKWINEDGSTWSNFENIAVKKIPVSGYFEIENFDLITYIPYS